MYARQANIIRPQQQHCAWIALPVVTIQNPVKHRATCVNRVGQAATGLVAGLIALGSARIAPQASSKPAMAHKAARLAAAGSIRMRVANHRANTVRTCRTTHSRTKLVPLAARHATLCALEDSTTHLAAVRMLASVRHAHWVSTSPPAPAKVALLVSAGSMPTLPGLPYAKCAMV